MANTIARRGSGIDTRIAPGSEPGNMIGMVMCNAWLLAAIGGVVGVPVSLALVWVVLGQYCGQPLWDGFRKRSQ